MNRHHEDTDAIKKVKEKIRYHRENPSGKSATEESLERMQYKTEASDENDEISGKGESIRGSRPLSLADQKFESELEFDGYDDIADYDNDTYSANIDKKPDTTEELHFKERSEDEPALEDEEKVTDKQENASLKNASQA